MRVAGVEGDLRDRRAIVLATHGLNGIDFIEVDAHDAAAQRRIRVHLLKPLADPLRGRVVDHPERFRLTSHGRDPSPVVTGVREEADHVLLELDRAGGFAPHILHADVEGLDPAFSVVPLDFKADCPARFDCAPRPPHAPAPPAAPDIDYETRDYAGFRALLLERLRTTMPDWDETNAADVVVTLVEQMAWAADRLSYQQDAVATEAFLDTARTRTAVRRHARLVDHRLHDGTSAQTLVHVAVAAKTPLDAGTPVLARIPPDPALAHHGPALPDHALDDAADRAGVVYETQHDAELHPDQNTIAVHAWHLTPSRLAAGSTTADLVGDLTGHLHAGDLLLFEEVLDPRTGLPQDADPEHRHAVRLTRVESAAPDPVGDRSDPLHPAPLPLTRVHWDPADALPLDLPLNGHTTTGVAVDGATVARGNLVVADHGRTRTETHQGPVPPPHEALRRAHRVALDRVPLSHRVRADAARPARDLHHAGTDGAEAQVHVHVESADRIDPAPWTPGDLLAADPLARTLAVEPEDDRVHLRFGDDRLGRAPPDGSTLHVTYRVGNGPAGHVGHDALAHVVQKAFPSPVLHVRNPLPSWGGLPPETLGAARRDAPRAFRDNTRRAVTEDDHARITGLHPEVQHAAARFRWTGSWHTVFLYVDPVGRPDLDEALAGRVHDWVRRVLQTGYDLEVRGPLPAPIDLHVDVCAAPDHLPADVERAVRDALGTGVLPDGTRAFFHPDRHTFGQSLHLSRIQAAVEAVEGVDSLRIAALARADGGPAPRDGRLDVGPLEIVRLDDDPDHPDNGRLTVTVRGGAA